MFAIFGEHINKTIAMVPVEAHQSGHDGDLLRQLGDERIRLVDDRTACNELVADVLHKQTLKKGRSTIESTHQSPPQKKANMIDVYVYNIPNQVASTVCILTNLTHYFFNKNVPPK
jgi:hypothetical protein